MRVCAFMCSKFNWLFESKFKGLRQGATGMMPTGVHKKTEKLWADQYVRARVR